MPFPHPSRTPSGPRRRTLLASAAGAALLAGCSAGPEETARSASRTPSVTERVRARAARESDGLVARYDAALAVHPTLAARLAPLRAEVVRHLAAFGGVGTASPSASPTASPSAAASFSPSAPVATAAAGASAPPSAAAPSAAAPATERDALVGLAAAERALADRRAAELLDVPGELARLLASVAAAGAAHAYLLTEGTR
ncbi:hypothetical protein ACWGH3_18885 [Streptomyces sp. NPDC054884]|uniref:hypothetical protein n=1 Tax=Streptomyces sp. ME08-AFT2 TaxID=3028683 RepID=UPI0029ACA700|nr:hypothetical protein [Streptomyces sp. ME08-AFT2]MDX3315247.1 hypothetical protein [Streptomyces sp. ME08-AFT2]